MESVILMSMERWEKVFANAGVAFFTTMTGLGIAVGNILPAQDILLGALFASTIQGGLAFFLTLRDGEKHLKGSSKLLPF